MLASRGASGIDGLVPAAALPGPFERVFGTSHGARIRDLAAAAGSRTPG